ncbi:MAG: hypothetical protein NT150_14595 [Bacteroidetes bacterium]|nr:hypothetical protein [Bacteroidota bacterium]
MYKYFILSVLFAFIGCGTSEEVDPEISVENETSESQFEAKKLIVFSKNGIILTEFNDFPLFSDVELKLVSPKDNKARVGKNDFEYEVKRFPMGDATSEADKTGFKLEEEGQHIKFIYSGHLPKIANSTTIEENLSAGENYVFAVLSRSYDLTVHHSKKGYVMSKISIYDNKSKIDTATGSHMIPISPAGQYEFEKSKKILLDFYLVNTQLSEKGNYVLVTIDNTEFMIKKWTPFIIEGLLPGMHSVSFKLMDASGHLISGPFNDVGKMEFTIKEKQGLLN